VIAAETLPSAVGPELLPEPTLPHDATLEPSDETVAEVQSLVCASRQIAAEMPEEDLIAAMSAALRQLIEAPSSGYAVALASFALRYREEHC
jgi:hypothetical protein